MRSGDTSVSRFQVQQTRGRSAGRPVLSALRRPWQEIVIGLNVSGPVTMGTDFRLGQGSTMTSAHGLTIGDHVAIGRNCTVEVCGVIGDFTLVAAQVGIIGRDDHTLDEVGIPVRYSTWVGDRECVARDRVDVGRDVWVGFGATILGGVTIGDCSVIAAGSLVTKDVDPFDIVAGRPAMPVGRRFSSTELRREHLEKLFPMDYR